MDTKTITITVIYISSNWLETIETINIINLNRIE